MQQDIDFSGHPWEFQRADALVREWMAAHHGYLKDPGGPKGMHFVPRCALVAAIAGALKALIAAPEPIEPYPMPIAVGEEPETEAKPKRGRKKKADVETSTE